MRIEVVGQNIGERLALGLGVMPTPLGETFWGMGTARCVIAGLKLGVFEALAGGPKEALALARELRCDPAGMAALLAALCGFGYLHRRGGLFSLSRKSRSWLTRASPRSIVDALLFMQDVWRWLGPLEEAVQTGVVARVHDSPQPPEFWQRYMTALAAFARLGSGEIVRKVGLPQGVGRLLDIGGGHGVYSAAFCARHPGLSAQVLDLPESAAVGRTLGSKEPGGERVSWREGDFRQADLGEGWDAVLVFNVLHNATEAEARSLLGRAAASLKPGGRLVVLEAVHPPSDGDLNGAAGFGELFFYLVSAAQAWPEEVMMAWMSEAGLSPLKRKGLLTSPSVLLMGTRPG